MILYFSATGNGKYISEQIAERTNETCMSIVDCIREDKYSFYDEEIIGIVVPTYFWRLPRIVAEYLAYYSVVMPDTWTPVFDLTDKNRVDKWLSDGKKQLERVIDNIISKRKGDFIDRKLPRWITAIPTAYMYETERKTKNLSVNKDICIGCGVCAKKCPAGAIQMKDGYPVWKPEECEMCLGCLHRCPKFAISYGNGKTDRHGQYRNPYTRI